MEDNYLDDRFKVVLETNYLPKRAELSCLFSKLSLVVNILPYFSYPLTWKPLLELMGSKTNEFGNNHHKELKQLSETVSWSNDKKEILQHYKTYFGTSPSQNYELELYLDEPNDKRFLSKTGDLRFAIFQTIELYHLQETSQIYKSIICSFLKSLLPIPREKLILSSFRHIRLTPYQGALPHVLPNILTEVKINKFILNEIQVKMIFEGASKVRKLNFYNCKIKVSEDFGLDTKLDYKIQVLGLDKSVRKLDNKYLDEEKLTILVNKLSQTNLKDSLSKVIVWPKQYDSDEVQEIFQWYNFNVQVDQFDETGSASERFGQI